jgi:hypothetical protein
LGSRRRIFHAMKLINGPPRGGRDCSIQSPGAYEKQHLQLLWDAGIVGRNSFAVQGLSVRTGT